MPLTESVVVDGNALDVAVGVYRRQGFVILRGLYEAPLLARMEQELADAQRRLIAGELDDRYGSSILDEPGARIDGQPYRHYVVHCTELSPATAQACNHHAIATMARKLFDGEPWIDEPRFGVVYQVARPEAGSRYSRIGWHSDFQSGEELPVWPGFAFTIHLDGTSPANGFLRVVPGSHLQSADRDELGARRFDPIDGEVPVFAARGDVILHDYKLWHGAARGTADGAAGVRRHVRGGCYLGKRPAEDVQVAFYKNAAR